MKPHSHPHYAFANSLNQDHQPGDNGAGAFSQFLIGNESFDDAAVAHIRTLRIDATALEKRGDDMENDKEAAEAEKEEVQELLDAQVAKRRYLQKCFDDITAALFEGIEPLTALRKVLAEIENDGGFEIDMALLDTMGE